MSANQVATLSQTLLPGQSYSQVAIGTLLSTYPVGAGLQIGPDAGPNIMVRLAEPASTGDEVLNTQAFITPVEFVSGVGIFDPTSSTGADTTAQRPGAPTVGAQFYDTTLSKPIWFDGAVWRDAAGNAV